MHKCVLDLLYFVRVPKVSESAEARTIQVHSQRLVRGDKNINSHIKFFTPDQQRVHYVLLHNIRLGLRRFWLPAEVILPLSYLSQLVKQENAFSLTFANRLHDPDSALLLKFFNKE